ncbi:MAG TPA: arsenic resistance N-acetyltransferase ArsN2 [Steroidobacteraceae bacterium]|nr:arsenic resistance N-acetyltransferase ArsN2 [Steroidobacteraceae bacterium]
MNAIHARPSLAAARALLEAAQLPTADLTPDHCERFFYQGPPDAPTGLVGLELFGDVALLRSLVVRPTVRAAGLGSALLRHAEGFARSTEVNTVYLLTTTAEEFFTRRGYVRTARESAPPAIRTTREFAGICPASSAFMSKTL